MAMAGVKMRWVFLISLQLILILMILPQFPCSIDAYYNANFPAANVSKSWRNDPSNERGSLEFSDGSMLRPILGVYNKSLSHRAFGLGFFTNTLSSSSSTSTSSMPRRSNFYLVVFMLQANLEVKAQSDDDQFLFNYNFSPLIFWSSNRDKPVEEGATLDFTSQGKLVLKDADGTPVWFTNNSANAIRMEITPEGNLLLVNGGNNSVVWQSFDHPTDTWLPNQRIHVGKRLTARISPSNLSTGIYYFSVENQSASFQISSSGHPKSYASLSSYEVESYGIELLETYAYFNFTSNASDFQYVVLEPNGHLIVYWVHREDLFDFSLNKYYDVLGENTCIPEACGHYGICWEDSQNQYCTCPDQNGELNYFKQFERNNSVGCQPITPLSCQEDGTNNYHAFLELPRVTYFDVQPTLRNISPEECREECYKNCSCKAAFFSQNFENSSGECSLQSDELYSLTGRKEQVQFLAFIKVQQRSDHGKKHASLAPVLVPSLVGGLVFVIFVAGICYRFRVLKNKDHDAEEEGDDEVTEALTKFSFDELKSFTRNFQIKLGQGGFGSVFEGVLSDGKRVAVKRLDSAGQGRKEFLAEVNTIGKVDHFNLVKLIGYCAEKSNRLLVYEHMCNGSLDNWIFNQDRATTLTWDIRHKIICGVAKGLEYLHEECSKKIIHFDIKPQNILLDANFNPKISDFGLAKLIDRNQSLVLTKLKGTPGYLAPELFGGSNVSVKADVYSFGIVILETMCGRRNLDLSKSAPLVHILKTEAEENQLYDVLDQRNENFLCHQEAAMKMINIGISCLQTYDKRPNISMVVKALEGSNMELITDLRSLTMIHTDNSIQVMNPNISAAPEASILSGPR